jgi:hypothetical protein
MMAGNLTELCVKMLSCAWSTCLLQPPSTLWGTMCELRAAEHWPDQAERHLPRQGGGGGQRRHCGGEGHQRRGRGAPREPQQVRYSAAAVLQCSACMWAPLFTYRDAGISRVSRCGPPSLTACQALLLFFAYLQPLCMHALPHQPAALMLCCLQRPQLDV